MKLSHLKDYFDKYVNCVILVESSKKIKTKKGEDMVFISGSDDTDVANFVLFANELNKAPNFKVGDLLYVNGRVTKRFADYQININKIQILKNGE